jgi:hypothetical protein
MRSLVQIQLGPLPIPGTGRKGSMKKLLAVVIALAAGALIFSKIRASRAENDLWHEATNS